MNSKVALDFTTICQRIKDVKLPEIDRVVGIGTGGIVPASLLAYALDKPLDVMQINFRNEDNSPRHEQPLLLGSAPSFVTGTRVLLVDDVAVSGQTLRVAKAHLSGCHIITLVLKGQGDFVLFPEVAACVKWPWKFE